MKHESRTYPKEERQTYYCPFPHICPKILSSLKLNVEHLYLFPVIGEKGRKLAHLFQKNTGLVLQCVCAITDFSVCKSGWVTMCPWCVLASVLPCLRSTRSPGTMQRIWISATTYCLALLNTESHLGHKTEVQCHWKRDLSRVLRVGCASLKSYTPSGIQGESWVLFESRKKD